MVTVRLLLSPPAYGTVHGRALPATIIIAESFTRIIGSTAGNVYSTIVAVVSCSITLWILVWWAAGPPPPPPADAGAVHHAPGLVGCR